MRPAARPLTRATRYALRSSTRAGHRRLDTRIDRRADPTPFRHSFTSNSTNLSKYVTQYHTSRQNLHNRPRTARSTMAQISRGERPTLDDAPKKIAICRTASQSYGNAAIVSCRSRTQPTGGEAGLLISVDRPRWSSALMRQQPYRSRVRYFSLQNMPRVEREAVKRDISDRSSA